MRNEGHKILLNNRCAGEYPRFEAGVGSPKSLSAQSKPIRSNMRFISDMPPQGVMFLSLKLSSKSLMFAPNFILILSPINF